MAEPFSYHGLPRRISLPLPYPRDLLLAAVDEQATIDATDTGGEVGVERPRKAAKKRALAARDHATFSTMIYAGLRIEETTALVLEDLSFARGEEQIRVAKGKGNKERVVPMSPKLRRSLKRYLKVREDVVPAGKTPPTYLFLSEKGERVTENIRHLVLAGQPRTRQGTGGAYGTLRPQPGDEVRPFR